MAVALRLLAVIEPINDTVMAVKERAAAHSGVHLAVQLWLSTCHFCRIVHAARTREEPTLVSRSSDQAVPRFGTAVPGPSVRRSARCGERISYRAPGR
jgi:hypothetical protein